MGENTYRGFQDLTVKGESVERIYGNYQDRRYIVNRRYQRKLVWTLEEKRRFIDSIIKGYPVPIVLLAERKAGTVNHFEILDGMQRLNAIMGFIENEYSVNEKFFDLNTMAGTKVLLDSGNLIQQEPTLDREACVRVAAYTLPLSIYEFSDNREVDEVFIRINSGGRKLSRQELRIAGATGHFAQAVRQVSARVRGDVSLSDLLHLNEMKKISITNRELNYGIDVDEIFWVKHGVLTKENVRESRDEEIVADILAYMLLADKPASRSEYLDDYFGFSEGESQRLRFSQVEVATQKFTVEAIALDFQRVLDQIKNVLDRSGMTFGQLLFGEPPARAPRYFQVVFLAFHRLTVGENMEVADVEQLIRSLKGGAKSITIAEGGRWGAEERQKTINGTVGLIQQSFQPAKSYDPARTRWITQLENILIGSFTEQAAYDFKQGFLRLDDESGFDQTSFEKVLKTLVAIANLRRDAKGYVLVGIAEKNSDAERVRKIFGIEPREYEGFYLTGVEHEANSLGKSLDQYFQLITDKIKRSDVSEPLKDCLARNVKLVRYYEKSILVLESQAQRDPSSYGGVYYIRHGNSLETIPPERYGELFRRFQEGR